MAETSPKEWLEGRGVDFNWARKTAEQIKTRYPRVHMVFKNHREVEVELEFMVLIHDVMNRKFPTQPGMQE